MTDNTTICKKNIFQPIGILLNLFIHPSSSKSKRSSETVFIDYRWNARIHGILVDLILMENTLAWMNTLGGAYSALGENSLRHARVAQSIALKQLEIAEKFDDPILKIRCNLYIAFGLLQRGKFRTAKAIISNEMNCIKIKNDYKLYNMSISALERLKLGASKHKSKSSNEK